MKDLVFFRYSLLRWYHKHKRDLPWRRTKNPYAVWVSEIMLQQTTVACVIPYFERFIKTFPTLESFASATETEYLKLWQGLGYYNRIRHFHQAAQKIVNECGGKIPTTKEELRNLPGLGDYTAAAIASIAFGEAVPVVDGNVRRVLARLAAYEKDIRSTEAENFFRKRTSELLDSKNPGDFNQALMELGATICTPKKPLCSACPVRSWCEGTRKNPESYPVKRRKTKYVSENYFGLIYRQGDKVLLRQRLKGEILSGLWEFPLEKMKSRLPPFFKNSLKPICHTIMNRRMKIYPVFKKLKLSERSVQKIAWVPLGQLDQYPLSTTTHKMIRQLVTHHS